MDNAETCQEVRCLFAFSTERVVRSPYIHSHNCVELIYFDGASGYLCEGKRRWRYSPNQVAVYQPGPPHWAQRDEDAPGRHICIGVAGGDTGALPAGVRPADRDVMMLFHLVANALVDPMPRAQQEQRLNEMASLICRALRRRKSAETQAGVPEYARLVKDLIDVEFAEPLTQEQLAARVCISVDHMRVLFKTAYGMPPSRYLARRRIEHAKGVLRTNAKKIADVAKMSGFGDPYYFSRVFKKVVGVTPTQYREENSEG